MVLAAFARMRYRDRDMMLRIAECTPAILGQFGANEITWLGAPASRPVPWFGEPASVRERVAPRESSTVERVLEGS